MNKLKKLKNKLKRSSSKSDLLSEVNSEEFVFSSDGQLDDWIYLQETYEKYDTDVNIRVQNNDSKLYGLMKIFSYDDEEEKDKLVSSLKVFRQLNDVTLQQLKDCYCIDKHIFIVKEYTNQTYDAREVMDTLCTTFKVSQLSYIMGQISKGLLFLHARRIIHRDVKGSNIFLSANGSVKLGGLELCILLPASKSYLTECEGSLYWMAPEMVLTDARMGSYNVQCDIWSLGITMFELIYGNPPNHEDNPFRAMQRTLKKAPPTLKGNKNYGIDATDFLERCVKQKSEDRMTSAELIKHPFTILGTVENIRTLMAECTSAPAPSLLKTDVNPVQNPSRQPDSKSLDGIIRPVQHEQKYTVYQAKTEPKFQDIDIDFLEKNSEIKHNDDGHFGATGNLTLFSEFAETPKPVSKSSHEHPKLKRLSTGHVKENNYFEKVNIKTEISQPSGDETIPSFLISEVQELSTNADPLLNVTSDSYLTTGTGDKKSVTFSPSTKSASSEGSFNVEPEPWLVPNTSSTILISVDDKPVTTTSNFMNLIQPSENFATTALSTSSASAGSSEYANSSNTRFISSDTDLTYPPLSMSDKNRESSNSSNSISFCTHKNNDESSNSRNENSKTLSSSSTYSSSFSPSTYSSSPSTYSPSPITYPSSPSTYFSSSSPSTYSSSMTATSYYNSSGNVHSSSNTSDKSHQSMPKSNNKFTKARQREKFI